MASGSVKRDFVPVWQGQAIAFHGDAGQNSARGRNR